MSFTTTITSTEASASTVGSLDLRGSTLPLARNHLLDQYPHHESTPVIGEEFSSELQLSQLLKLAQADDFIRDLAVLGKRIEAEQRLIPV